MRVVLAFVAVVGLLGLSPAPTAEAQGFPFCSPGQTPRFLFGFAALKAQLGATMGDPVECEHPNSANGDTLQKTTTGLAFYRKSTNTPTFTDGWRHWALTAQGLVFWEGDSIDPPGVTVAPPRPVPPSPPPAAPTGRTLEGFVRQLVAQVNEYWSNVFAGAPVRYSPPRVIVTATPQPNPTICTRGGGATPGYCPADTALYVPLVFFADLWPDLDAAIAIVISHEWGHHVQRLTGITLGDHFPIQRELQADCFAGDFFSYSDVRGWLDPGDLDEAVYVLRRDADAPGTLWYARDAHGTPDLRVGAFLLGFRQPGSCFDLTP